MFIHVKHIGLVKHRGRAGPLSGNHPERRLTPEKIAAPSNALADPGKYQKGRE